jgi:hypothetical protein
VDLQKVLSTVAFKKQYLNLYTKIIAMKNINNFRIIDKLKTAKEIKQMKKA